MEAIKNYQQVLTDHTVFFVCLFVCFIAKERYRKISKVHKLNKSNAYKHKREGQQEYTNTMCYIYITFHKIT